MSSDPYIGQLEQNVTILLTDHRFKDAEKLCLDVLKSHPEYQAEVKALLQKITVAIADQNEKVIEKQLEDLEVLWNSKDYPTLIQELRKIIKIDPRNFEANDQLLRAQKAYLKVIDKNKKNFVANQAEEFERLLKEDPAELLQALFEFEKSNVSNEAMLKLAARYRDKLLEQKLSTHDELIKSGNIHDIEHLLAELENIDKSHPKLAKIRSMLSLLKLDDYSNQKLEFLYSAREHLDTLLQLKKYDKALQLAEEILSQNPKDSFVRKVAAKARRRLYSETRDITVEKITDDLAKTRSDFEQDPSSFIRL